MVLPAANVIGVVPAESLYSWQLELTAVMVTLAVPVFLMVTLLEVEMVPRYTVPYARVVGVEVSCADALRLKSVANSRQVARDRLRRMAVSINTHLQLFLTECLVTLGGNSNRSSLQWEKDRYGILS